MSVRLVLVDDHALLRAGICALIAGLADFEVVGEARDGPEAIEVVDRTRPDILLLDLTLPGLNGLGVAARVAKAHPEVRIVILSMHANEEYVRQTVRAGAVGYLLKDASAEELEQALLAVARGETYLSTAISKRVVDDYMRRVGSETDQAPSLTPRQTEILQLLAEGKSTKEIAHRLRVSIKTVETHRALMGERLGIDDLAGLVRYAIRIGLVSADS